MKMYKFVCLIFTIINLMISPTFRNVVFPTFLPPQ